MNDQDRRILVRLACQNAMNNGYNVVPWPAREVAKDMIRHDAQLENEDPWALVPFIQEWQQEKKAGRL